MFKISPIFQITQILQEHFYNLKILGKADF